MLLQAFRNFFRSKNCSSIVKQGFAHNFHYKFAHAGGIFTALFLLYSYEERKQLARCAFAEGQQSPTKKVHIKLKDLAQHCSMEKGIWVTYNGRVYDVTEFVEQHPGGDKILMGAGKSLEPFWSLYAFHREPNVLEILDKYYIGDLDPADVAANKPSEKTSGPYANDPMRHPALVVNTITPFNAECPPDLIVHQALTPNDIFFVRNHLSVPDIDLKTYKIELQLFSLVNSAEKGILELDILKKAFPPRAVTTTIQCAGNRRKDMQNRATETGQAQIHGLSWGHTALSTAKWEGASLIDVITYAIYPVRYRFGCAPAPETILKQLKESGVHYVQFQGYDGDPTIGDYGASVPVDMALDPRAEIILAYKMNDIDIPRDHGFPVRVIIPGVIGARQVKWLKKITLSDHESPSFWQQKDYKFVLPNSTPDYAKLPAIMDYPVQSAICQPKEGQKVHDEGSITVKGYALSGSGRSIESVTVSADGGLTWHEATLTPANAPGSRNWAWTIWELDIPTKGLKLNSSVQLLCKARDSSQAVQPENFTASYNARGLMSNAWHKVNVQLVE